MHTVISDNVNRRHTAWLTVAVSASRESGFDAMAVALVYYAGLIANFR